MARIKRAVNAQKKRRKMMKLAKDVKYTGLYGMNNLIIHI